MSQRTNIIRMRRSLQNSKPWLCFTAEEDGCVIRLNKTGSPDPVQLEISIDGGKTWVHYSWSGNTGATINLNRGDKCYWRADSLNSTFSTSASDYYRFVNTGSMSISGEVSSLLEIDGVLSIPDWAFFYLFRECTALTGVVEIKAQEVNFRSLQRLFQGCTSLETAPDLPARILGENCYQAMFQGCTSLRVAPKLLVTALSVRCYYQMFLGCTSLEIAPDLPAETLVNACYYQMFQGCTSLRVVRVKFKEWTSATQGWLDGVAATGTFECPSELPSIRGVSNIPEGWTIHKKGYFNSADGIFYNNNNFTSPAVVVESLTNDEYYIDIPTGDVYAYSGTNMEKINLS